MEDILMRPSPFLDDPRDLLTYHVTLAMNSTMQAVAALHISAAIHQAELAKASGLSLPHSPARKPS
jgi:hypothetical protein